MTPSRAASAAAIAALATALSACGSAARAEGVEPVVGVTSARTDAPVDFRFDSLDERPVSAAAMHGRLAVLTFFTTGNLASQAQVNFLMAMAKHDGDRVAYALVAAEPRQNRELVEIYRTKLGVPFPVALLDDETATGRGPFGALDEIPVTVVLDRDGRIVWRKVGVAKADEIRAAMHAADERRPAGAPGS